MATYDVPDMRDELGFYSITMYGDDNYLHTEEFNNVNSQNMTLNADGKTFDVYYGSAVACGDVDNRLQTPTETIFPYFRVYLPSEELQEHGFEMPELKLVK